MSASLSSQASAIAASALLCAQPHVDDDVASVAAREGRALDALLTRGELRSAYQPIVELDTGATVGFEALARAPQGIILDRPDVIKLDLSLVQTRPSSAVATIVTAVNAEAERSGSAVLAEGIETEEHRKLAMAMGASLGQGWLLGRPLALALISRIWPES